MQRVRHGPIRLLLGAVLLAAAPAGAADLYFSGSFAGYASATGSATGKTDFFNIGGSDTDVSPAYGGTLGLDFGIDEAIPKIKELEMPPWLVRTELEFQTGRDYQFRTDGANSNNFFNEVTAWTLMPDFALEVPLRTPITWLFGRIPVLEPMSLTGNVGLGVAEVNLDVTDNVSKGAVKSVNFAWQAGVGLSYQLTDITTFTFGWRYVSLGQSSTELKFGPGAKAGPYSLDLSSQEFVAGLRINFYSAPLKDMNPRYWRMPRARMPGWMPHWLGGPSKDEGSDADAL